MTTSASAQMWATATSTNQNNGKVIIFRYVKELSPDFHRATQPDRVILVWKYKSKNKGMPEREEHKRMDTMEDALQPLLEKDGFATLALVSTGENLREWTYYVKSENEFIERFNRALKDKPKFPIEIHTAADPNWTTYETFKSGVQE